MCLEVVGSLQSFPDDSVVVNLAIDCKGNALVLVRNWLRSTFNTNDTQTLVSKNWLLLVIRSDSSAEDDILVLLAR